MSNLEAIWAGKTDEELLEAAAALSGYTEEAERIIRAELEKRSLPPADPPIGKAGTPETELVPLLSTGDAGRILLAKSLFESEGIEYLVRGEKVQDLFGVGRLGGYNYITGPTEFWVHAHNAERSRALLDGLNAQPPEPGVGSDDA